MKRFLLSLGLSLAPLAFAPSQAMAGFVFYDDFNGSALLPHWNLPQPMDWEYNVSNSMLNVTGLFNPSDPKIPSNFAGMNAPFENPQTDFRMDVWMGWEAGDAPHRLEVAVQGGPGGGGAIIARFIYRNEFPGDPTIRANVTGQSVSMPAPPPGIYHFTIARTGTNVDFFFNEQPFASFSGASGLPATGLGFLFVGPYPGEFGDFHIDRVQVVPMPPVFLITALGLLASRGRRRRG